VVANAEKERKGALTPCAAFGARCSSSAARDGSVIAAAKEAASGQYARYRTSKRRLFALSPGLRFAIDPDRHRAREGAR
jgi:hypothetical protein